MLAYIVRRLLLMIPTLLGVLAITFAIVRVRGASLFEEMQASASLDSEAGSRDASNQVTRVSAYLVRFKETGNDLPALLNFRGFATKESVAADIRWAYGLSGSIIASDAFEAQANMYLNGRPWLEPLRAIIADDAYADIHAPAIEFFTICAFDPIRSEEANSRDPIVVAGLRERSLLNKQLEGISVQYQADLQTGITVQDSAEVLQEQRQAVLDLYETHAARWQQTTYDKSLGIVLNTGFVDFFSRLFTGRLYSETRQENVFVLIGNAWYITFGLNITAIILAWGISIPLGIRGARKAGSLEDTTTTNGLFVLWSMPSFFLGTLILVHLCTNTVADDGSIQPAWFPDTAIPSSRDTLFMPTIDYIGLLIWSSLMPLLVLSYNSFTAMSRYMRGNMLDNLHAPFARTARAKGCSEDRVVYRHVLPNSMLTMITLGSGLLAELFGGFVVVEMLWSIPGLGTLLLEGATNNDIPLVMGSTLISVVLLLVSILIADLLYAVVDPRIRSRYAGS